MGNQESVRQLIAVMRSLGYIIRTKSEGPYDANGNGIINGVHVRCPKDDWDTGWLSLEKAMKRMTQIIEADDEAGYEGDASILSTRGTLGNDSGGGQRVIRSTRNL